jgi:hypothetical protein
MGANHVTVALWSPAVATGVRGSVGGSMACGVTGFDGADAWLSPTAFVATTVKVYEVPFVKPDTMACAAPGPTLTLMPSGSEVIV